MKDSRAIETLIDIVLSADTLVHEKAVTALEKIDPNWRLCDYAKKKGSNFIWSGYKEETERRIESLGKWKAVFAIEGLVKFLILENDEGWGGYDSQHSLSAAAARALGAIGDPSVVPALSATLLYHKLDQTRYVSAIALGKLKDPRAIKPLISALDDNPYIRIAAFTALTEITGQDFGEDKKRWKTWWQKNKTNF